MIGVCPSCAHSAQYADKYAGKTVRCLKCRQPVDLFISDEDEIEVEPSKPKAANPLADFLSFRAFAAPVLVQLLFWANAVFSLVVTINILRAIPREGNSGYDAMFRAMVVIGLPVWILFVRVACEFVIVVFRIHDEMKAAREAAEKAKSMTGD